MKHFLMALGGLLLMCMPALAQPVPRVETYAGYAFTRFHGSNVSSPIDPAFNTDIPSFNANGGVLQLVINTKKGWLGFVADAGAYHKGSIGGFDIETTVVNYSFGPRVWFNKKHRINPYAQVLVGGTYAAMTKGFAPLFPQLRTGSTTDSAFGLLAGVGLDIRLHRHIAFKPFEASYFYTRLNNPVLDSGRMQDNFRYTGGVAFLFGGEKPAPPPPQPAATRVCPDGTVVPVSQPCPNVNMKLALSPTTATVCQGETVPFTLTTDANLNTSFQWSVNGQNVSQGRDFQFGTAGVNPGTYEIKVAGSGPGLNPAAASATVTVKEYQPPTGTVTASPSEIMGGEKSTLSSNFTGQCGGPIQPATYTASEGRIVDSQFDSTGICDPSSRTEQRKVVTITATARDDKSSGSATTTVTVVCKASAAAVRLPDVLFPMDSSRVNNCGKRILIEQVQSYFQRDPGGQVVLSGHAAENEKVHGLAEQRVRNAAAVITAGTGVCLSIPASQVIVAAPGTDQQGVSFQPGFCGASTSVGATPERPGQMVKPGDTKAEARRVVVWFVPSGGQLPESLGNHSTAASLNITACPK